MANRTYIRKCQQNFKFWVERFQSSIQKLNFGNSKQKGWRSRYETFSVGLILLNLIVLLKIWPGLWERFACSPNFQRWFKFLEKMLIWLKKLFLSKNFQLVNLKLSQVKFWAKPNLQKSIYTKIWIWKMQWMQKCEDWRNGWMLGNWAKLMPISFLLRLGQNIWHKVKKSSKIGPTKKLWYLLLQPFWLLEETGHWARSRSPPGFKIFEIFPIFLRSYILIRLADNSCMKFVVVDIKLCFTLGESNLY